MIYIPQRPVGNIDISHALTFCPNQEPVVLLPEGDIILSPGPTIRRLGRSLSEFSDKDYLVLIGDPVAIGMCTAVAANLNRGQVRVLRWMKRQQQYTPLTLNFWRKVEG